MSESIERHSYVSITSQNVGTVTRTQVYVAQIEATPQCFDVNSSCDEQEKALIAFLRRYLRPQTAPQCLIDRLEETLDRCCLHCGEEEL